MIAVFLGNIWAGIIAGVLVLFGQCLARNWKQRRSFVGFNGTYEILNMPDLRPSGTAVRIHYSGQNVLATEGISAAGDVEWVGRIYMNEAVPDMGQGFYQYSNFHDCGVHQIQRSPADGTIYAWGKNTSHGRENVFARLWRRSQA